MFLCNVVGISSGVRKSVIVVLLLEYANGSRETRERRETREMRGEKEAMNGLFHQVLG